MPTPIENSLHDLIARISAGEPVDPASIPPELGDDPTLKRLLQFARVTGVFDRNFESDAAPDAAPSQLGPWRLLRLIGSGGMGEVWLGERSDEIVEQRVAIKRVRMQTAEVRERLFSERRLLARLEHPNIARFIDAGVDAAGSPWLVLEYVEGVPISDWCSQQALSLRDRLRLFGKVCAAVEHAHRHLIVHRDLKPANVLVNADGEPKLLDFGIAKLLDGNGDGNTVGALTPSYAAPEQLRGEAISTATDVYALGLLLYRLLAGALPATRQGAGAAVVLARLDDEETQRPSQTAALAADALPYSAGALRGDLDAIVAQAMRARPESRYGSVAELSADIERTLEARPVLARVPSRGYRFARFARRNRLALLLGLLAVLALIIGTTVSIQQARNARQEAESARRELARAERISEFLASLYREQDPLSRGTTAQRSAPSVLADAVARVDRELHDDARSSAQLLRVLGEAQLNLGELDAARITLDHAADAARKSSDELLSADIDAVRGALATRELHHDDAERLFATALKRVVDLRGADSLEAARVETRRAMSLVAIGKFKEALGSAEHSHAILLKRFGSGNAESITALITLGTIQEQLRDDQSSLQTMREAVATIESTYDKRDARLVWPLQTLGEVMRRTRDLDGARRTLLQGVAIAREQFGAISAPVSLMLVRLAGVERDASAWQRAIEVLDQAEKALPDNEDDAARAQILNTRGGTWIELGDGKRAEADYRASLALRKKAGDQRSGVFWFTQAQVGTALAMQGRYTEALRLQREAALEIRKMLGPDAYQNALIAVRLAQTFTGQEDYTRAAIQWREAVRLIELTYGRDHFGHFDWSLELASALEKSPADHPEAARIADDLLARWSNSPQISQRYVALVLLRCRLYQSSGQATPASELAQSALGRSDLVASPEQRQSLREFVVP
jgi:eukaryotic-like serine/threonine-protein kinase